MLGILKFLALTTLADEIIQTPLLAALNPIQDGGGGGGKALATSFSPVPSTNVGISPQNCHTGVKCQVCS